MSDLDFVEDRDSLPPAWLVETARAQSKSGLQLAGWQSRAAGHAVVRLLMALRDEVSDDTLARPWQHSYQAGMT